MKGNSYMYLVFREELDGRKTSLLYNSHGREGAERHLPHSLSPVRGWYLCEYEAVFEDDILKECKGSIHPDAWIKHTRLQGVPVVFPTVRSLADVNKAPKEIRAPLEKLLKFISPPRTGRDHAAGRS